MRSRGNNFSKTEINILLNIIEDVVPIGSEEWKQVETRHRQHYPQLDRSRDTLKRKFRQLYGSRPGTGNPTIPEEVRVPILLFTSLDNNFINSLFPNLK